MIDYAAFNFHPVIHLPEVYDVRDFTTLVNANRAPTHPYSIGRYDEDRVGLYVHELFEGTRTIHVGIDIGAPVETPVHAFWDGTIFLFGYNDLPGDYGHVIITHHVLGGVSLWALYGHLSAQSIVGLRKGQPIRSGEVLGAVGSEEENGGWPPHLHFQLSYVEPETHDMPGVVAPAERESALKTYPDPQLVLGRLYD